MLRLRFHGRGGQGVRLASRIVGRAAFLAGWTVQDAPLYGAERRGAPVVAFVRAARGPLRERGWIAVPDVVVLLDRSLLALPEAGVLDGVGAATVLIVDAPAGADLGAAGRARVVAHDVAALAPVVLGRRVASAPMAALVARVTGLAGADAVLAAIRVELEEAGADAAAVAGSAAAAAALLAAAPAIALPPRAAPPEPAPPAAFRVPRLPAAVAAPTILAPATSAARTTEGWRVERPVVERARCTRCLVCFVYCPEGAIALDDEAWPVVDYAHCKGCLVCATECPPQAIAVVPEAAATEAAPR